MLKQIYVKFFEPHILSLLFPGTTFLYWVVNHFCKDTCTLMRYAYPQPQMFQNVIAHVSSTARVCVLISTLQGSSVEIHQVIFPVFLVINLPALKPDTHRLPLSQGASKSILSMWHEVPRQEQFPFHQILLMSCKHLTDALPVPNSRTAKKDMFTLLLGSDLSLFGLCLFPVMVHVSFPHPMIDFNNQKKT